MVNPFEQMLVRACTANNRTHSPVRCIFPQLPGRLIDFSLSLKRNIGTSISSAVFNRPNDKSYPSKGLAQPAQPPN
jgi:hypothetical protein